MRILWFTNTPGLVSRSKNNTGCWISALQGQFEKNTEHTLGMVFYADQHTENFKEGSTHYFPVCRKGNTKLKRKWMQLIGTTEYKENIPQFLKIIEEFKPDLIHIHGTENPFGLFISEIEDIPVLVSIQGIITVYVRKYFSSINSYLLTDWRRNWNFWMAQNFSIFKKKGKIEREIMSQVSYLAGRTSWDRQVSKVLSPQAKYYHIDESLRPIFYGSRWEKPEGSTFKIFTTLSELPYKGINVLLEAAIELHRVGFDFEWHVAGLDWSSELLSVFDHKNELGDVPLILRGKLNEDELVNGLMNSHCFVQVSQIENSSNSLGEAMLLGLPCIATATGGTSTMLADGVEGLLVPEGDPYCVAGCILEYADKYPQLVAMGDKARIRAMDRHNPEKVIRQLLETYDSIMKKCKKAEDEL